MESQIESAEEAQNRRSSTNALTPAQLATERERSGLLLSRTRVLNDLKGVSNPQRREQLEEALRFLDRKLEALES